MENSVWKKWSGSSIWILMLARREKSLVVWNGEAFTAADGWIS